MKKLAILTSFVAASALSVPALAEGGTADSSAKIAGVASKDVASGLDDPNSPFEKNNQTYRFVGARFRYIIIPQFYMGLFGSGGTTVGVPAFGPEFTIRKNGFEYVLSAMYASYAMDPTPFKAKTDGNDAWEIVDTNIKALYLMSDFLWSSELSPKAAFLYGAGFGIAAVFGDIHRQQAQPANANAPLTSDPNTWVACPANAAGTGPGPGADPRTCGGDNNHYGNYTEPSWANGGSKPIVFPWLSVQTGFRFKPTKQFVARIDLGWNLLNGPFIGLAANYGL
jgi:hypothetical protein